MSRQTNQLPNQPTVNPQSIHLCHLGYVFKNKNLYFILFHFIHFNIPFGKLGSPYLGKTTAAEEQRYYAVLQVYAGSFRVSLVHRTQTLYRAHGIILMRAYTHGDWAHRQRVSTSFDSEKPLYIFLVIMTGFEPRVFGSRVRRSTT